MQFSHDTKQDSKQRDSKMTMERLEALIQAALRKVGASKENELCRYLPVPTGGYIHHFTMRKMKNENPSQLVEMIEKYIIQTNDSPTMVKPKPRAARGSRKRTDQITFSKQDLEKMLNMARLSGDREMIRKLTRKTKDRRTVVRELIASIRQGKVEPELWNNYVEVITAQNAVYSQASPAQSAAM